jgi:molybdenum cofactor biosynthesis protein B
MNNPVEEHKAAAPRYARVAVVTLSSSRTPANDKSGDVIENLLKAAGHGVSARILLPDDPVALRETLRGLVSRDDVQAIITTGGTGLAASDVTVETVRPMIEKEMTGFAALFMQLSYAQAGSAAMLSRAMAGIIEGKAIFCLPGSPRACQLATESLIIPEIGHILMLAGL